MGKVDAVRIFDGQEMVQEVSWTSHADQTLGRRPDNGEFAQTSRPTPGARNEFADIPNLVNWPGSDKVQVIDQKATFLEDSSGLDFHDGHLYAVDNGTGIFWKLSVDEQGQMSFSDGFEKGKRARFKKDADNPSAAGPDAEGITVAGNGKVYIAAERDNSDKSTNYNVILEIDPNETGPDLVASREWDLTEILPSVSANMGIEAVEWVANDKVNGRLFDQNTQNPFDGSLYDQAIADGVFFVGLEDNGHVYAFVLNEEETASQIAEIDPKIGGVMGLDYDSHEDVLWVQTDNGYDNLLTQIRLNGTAEPEILHVAPPKGLDRFDNNEGFAIASADFVVDGQRPVFWFKDGVKKASLRMGTYLQRVVKKKSWSLKQLNQKIHKQQIHLKVNM